MRLRKVFCLIFASHLLLSSCNAQQGSDQMNTTAAIDWSSLEFKCVHEKDLLPKPDAEADGWYQQANSLYKTGDKNGNQDLLKQSFDLMLKAALRGHIKAMHNVSLAYADGEGVKASERKAVEWAEKLVNLNVGMGYYQMGTFLEQGVGVKQDRKAALTYFRKAADRGNAQGQLASGRKIADALAQSAPAEKGRGFAISRAMLQCALDQGLAEAGYNLGKHYQIFEKRIPEALIAFQAAAKLGHNQSLFTLMLIFKEGRYGIEKDQARATCYQRLSDESDEDKTKKFPDLDRICPLPPKRMPNS